MAKVKILILAAIVVAAPIVVARFLPWWVTLLVLIAEITVILLLAPRLIGELVQEHLEQMFRERSKVLEGAEVEVMDVREIEPPAGAEPRHRYVQLDVCINPAGDQEFEPGDLLLVEAHLPSEPEGDYPSAAPQRVQHLEADGTTRDCESCSGLSKLRMVFAVPEALRGAVKLRYYYMDVGSGSEFNL